jgi:hypothetical protein
MAVRVPPQRAGTVYRNEDCAAAADDLEVSADADVAGGR